MSTDTADKIKAALAEAKASARMMIEVAGPEWENLPGYLKAARAKYGDSPAQNAIADKLALDCLLANPEPALRLINKRIADRAALAGDPLSEGALRALAGED